MGQCFGKLLWKEGGGEKSGECERNVWQLQLQIIACFFE